MAKVPFSHRWYQLSADLAQSTEVVGLDSPNGSQWIGPFASANVFIGPNNSGKSRVLRDLAQAGGEYPAILAGPQQDAFTSAIEKALPSLLSIFKPENPVVARLGGHDIGNYLKTLHEMGCGNREVRLRMSLNNFAPLTRPASAALQHVRQWIRPIPNSDAAEAVHFLETAVAYQNTPVVPQTLPLRRVYVPVLRGLRPLDGSNQAKPDDLFHKRTQTDYFARELRPPPGVQVSPSPPLISTGLHAYDEVHRHRNGATSLQDTLDAYEVFLSRRFFEGHRVVLTARTTDDQGKPSNVLWIKIGHEAQRPVYFVGDGLGQLIIQTLPMFLFRDSPLALFIEEPETHLHPGYQRLLLDAFLDEPCEGNGTRQVFFTTHSTVFMDMTLDSERVQLFRVTKKITESNDRERPTKTIVQAETQGTLAILRELGVSNSSVLLVNCTIWVEGRTDRLYIAHFLALLASKLQWDTGGKQLKADLHFSFMEYSGANIVHWSFLDEECGIDEKRLCGTLFLIADDDGASQGMAKGKAERHAQLKKTLGDRFRVLPCREIENLLSPQTIEAVVRTYEPTMPATPAIDRLDYAHEPLGRFIETRVLPKGYTSERRTQTGHPYADPSGTIKDKETFATRAIEHMKTWDALTPEAKAIAVEVASFIRAQNGMGEFEAPL